MSKFLVLKIYGNRTFADEETQFKLLLMSLQDVNDTQYFSTLVWMLLYPVRKYKNILALIIPL